jgi:hypothetical protein
MGSCPGRTFPRKRWSQHRGGIAEEHFVANHLSSLPQLALHRLSPAGGATRQAPA